jgi:hypothetical protein
MARLAFSAAVSYDVADCGSTDVGVGASDEGRGVVDHIVRLCEEAGGHWALVRWFRRDEQRRSGDKTLGRESKGKKICARVGVGPTSGDARHV